MNESVVNEMLEDIRIADKRHKWWLQTQEAQDELRNLNNELEFIEGLLIKQDLSLPERKLVEIRKECLRDRKEIFSEMPCLIYGTYSMYNIDELDAVYTRYKFKRQDNVSGQGVRFVTPKRKACMIL